MCTGCSYQDRDQRWASERGKGAVSISQEKGRSSAVGDGLRGMGGGEEGRRVILRTKIRMVILCTRKFKTFLQYFHIVRFAYA